MIDYCGNEPPRDVAISRDWSNRSTTPDQQRIEDVLDVLLSNRDTSGVRILHVGIGNSSLAARFCGRVAQVMGISVDEAEIDRARTMEIPNYYVTLANKYSTGMGFLQDSFYDFIVDNNPTSYACCYKHLGDYMRSLAFMLTSLGGVFLTDEEGLAYHEPYSNPYTAAEFKSLCALFGLNYYPLAMDGGCQYLVYAIVPYGRRLEITPCQK